MNCKTTISSVIALAASFAASADVAAQPAAASNAVARTVVVAKALLSDGSTVKGDLLVRKITGSAIFRGNLAIDPALVVSIAFPGAGNEAKVELENGDRFVMNVSNETFAVRSILGDIDIMRGNLRSLTLAKRIVEERGAEAGLVFHCTFDDEAAVATPAVGPGGTFLRGVFEQGKLGQSLRTAAFAQNAVFEFPSNFFGTAGCIEFWTKMQKQSSRVGAGGDPRLFTITRRSAKDTICALDIVSNNGCGNSGFSTWTFLGNMASVRGCGTLRYEDLFPVGDFRDWHHYAVVWDKDGIAALDGAPRMALLVDGRPVPDVQNDARSAEDAAAILAAPTLLSFTHDPELGPELSAKSPFLIDEFKIWNYARTVFDVAQ